MRYSITGGTIQQIQAVGGSNIKEVRSVKILFADLTEIQVQKLRNMGVIIEEVAKVSTDITPPAPVISGQPLLTLSELLTTAGVEQARQLLKPPLYGEGINVAIVDTGIRETHEQISGHIIHSKNFTTSPMRDGFSHGSSTAYEIAVCCPKTGILNLKVLDDKGQGTEEEVVMAIDHCIDLHDTMNPVAPHIINLSLGSPDDNNVNNVVRVICREAHKRGLWIVASAGNSGPAPGTIMSPACERAVFAVGACGASPFVVSNWSSRGPTKEGLIKPDLVLFGENMLLASSESDTAMTAKTGSSFSAPLLSGGGALAMEGMARYGQVGIEWPETAADFPKIVSPFHTWEGAEAILSQICIKPQGVAPGKDNNYGYGLMYGPLAMQAIGRAAGVGVFDISALLPMVMIMSIIPMIMKMAEGEQIR